MRDSTIWKYKLKLADEQTVRMPFDAEVLSVATQHGELCVWALVSPWRTKATRKFRIVGTGMPAPTGRFVGTVQQLDGNLIWHVFDCGEVVEASLPAEAP